MLKRSANHKFYEGNNNVKRRQLLNGIGAAACCTALSGISHANTVFRGYQPRSTKELLAWHASTDKEVAIRPGFPIVDPHVHLFNTPSDTVYYRPEDFADDLSAGHCILGTVYIEAYQSGWRTDGPENMRPVGEVERIVRLTPKPIESPSGTCRIAAGIVSHANLTAGNAVGAVLAAQKAAGDGRLRGVRHSAIRDEGAVGAIYKQQPAPRLLADTEFRKGIAQLQAADLSFDAWVYHHQLAEVADLAAAFPKLQIILNHAGGLIGVAEYRDRRSEAFELWRQGMTRLSRLPNVKIKLGGMGMTVFGFGFEDRTRPVGSDELVRAWKPLVDVCLENFGTKRCMFESNFPVDKQSTGYSSIWNAFKKLSGAMSEEEQRDLFYRTACSAYRLPDILIQGDAIRT